MTTAPTTPAPKRTLGVVDVTLFMVTASCTLQWTATAAAIGPSSLVIWVLGGLAMFLPLSVCVVFLSSRYPDEAACTPGALFIAAPMIAAIYIIGTTSILISIPAEQASGLYGAIESIRAAAGRLGLWWLVPVGAVCVAFDRIGSVCLWIGALARIPTSAGLDRYLPRSFTALHPKRGTPVVAIWTQAILVATLVVLGQSGSSVRSAYNVLIEMMIVASMLPILLLFGAAMKLSAEPRLEGEVRIRGGRVCHRKPSGSPSRPGTRSRRLGPQIITY